MEHTYMSYETTIQTRENRLRTILRQQLTKISGQPANPEIMAKNCKELGKDITPEIENFLLENPWTTLAYEVQSDVETKREALYRYIGETPIQYALCYDAASNKLVIYPAKFEKNWDNHIKEWCIAVIQWEEKSKNEDEHWQSQILYNTLPISNQTLAWEIARYPQVEKFVQAIELARKACSKPYNLYAKDTANDKLTALELFTHHSPAIILSWLTEAIEAKQEPNPLTLDILEASRVSILENDGTGDCAAAALTTQERHPHVTENTMKTYKNALKIICDTIDTSTVLEWMADISSEFLKDTDLDIPRVQKEVALLNACAKTCRKFEYNC